MKKASALIPAAGKGERFGSSINKVFVNLAGKPILAHTLSAFQSCDAVEEVIIVTGKNDIETAGSIVGRFGYSKVKAIVPGGGQRQDSVRLGLSEVGCEIVAIHDAARPLVNCEIITRSIQEAGRRGACIAAVPVIDTIKKATSQGLVECTIDRSNLYSIQTPQTFKTSIIREAHERAYADGYYATDDAALVERMGVEVYIVPGSYENIKITTASDLAFASSRLGGAEYRTGLGFDVHCFEEGRPLVLGGVNIPHDYGLEGHSDADVIIHAIMDALLGAAALGDIGHHFPNSDPAYKDIESTELLKKVRNILDGQGWRIGNIDATLACERPKIAPYIPQMQQNIADCLKIDKAQVSIKATTTEGLGYTGRGEGAACWAIAGCYRTTQ